MKLNNVTAVSTANASGFGAESEVVREARMKTLWGAKENSRIYMIGKLLNSVHDGKTLAQWVLDGEELEMSEVTDATTGRKLPLVAGYKLSLANMGSVWGCPACHSAHGTGVKPSPKVSAKKLGDAKFFYNPATKTVFTISDTCWGRWVTALGYRKNFSGTPVSEKADKVA